MSEFAQSFIAHLQRLQERDRGALATLRRILITAPEAWPAALAS